MIDRGILDRLGEARNQKAFGGGMASNVVRFDLRQKATRTASPIFETKQQKSGDGNDNNQQDVTFYARMNMTTAKAFFQIIEFYRSTIHRIYNKKSWLTDTTIKKIQVPRVVFGVEAEEAEYRQLYQWIRQLHTDRRKEFNTATFSSITISEGTRVVGILEYLICDQRQISSISAHIKSLAVLHALDVAIGMGDRLQNPNPANITLNPTTQQLVLIDVDSFLPPMNCHPNIEAACHLDEKYFTDNGTIQRKNENRNIHWENWDPCPPRLPLQGNYAKNISKALKSDLMWYISGLEGRFNDIKDSGQYHDKAISKTGKQNLSLYLGALSAQTQLFIETAVMALKLIKDRVTDKKEVSGFNVEDATCSAQRLHQRVNEWRF